MKTTGKPVSKADTKNNLRERVPYTQVYTPAQQEALQKIAQSIRAEKAAQESAQNAVQEAAQKIVQEAALPAVQQVPVRLPVQETEPRRPQQTVVQPGMPPERQPAKPPSTQRPAQPAKPQTVRRQAQPAVQQRPVEQEEPIKRTKKRASYKRSTRAVFITIVLVIVLSAAGFAGWYYWWTTHATFEYVLQPIVILNGQSVEPEDFLSPGEDMERVTAVYRRAGFRPAVGRQEVPLTLTRGWRTVDATAELYVLTPITQISHEFAEPALELKAVDFLSNADIASRVWFDVHFTEEPLPLEDYSVDVHTLRLALNGAPFEVLLNVADTTKPTATVGIVETIIGEGVSPEDFVTSWFDASHGENDPPSITFVNEPNVNSRSGNEQIIEIKIEDKYGNYDTFNASLKVLLDQENPVIEGTNTIQAMLGSNILYRQGVTAVDSFGRPLELVIDNSKVDTSRVGRYTVVFSATDLSGNSTKVEETVYIMNVDPEDIDRQVRDIIARITNDNMTELQKVRAIHQHVRSFLSYSAVRGRPNSVYEGAALGFQRRNGNCFVYYSLAELLLTEAGIENMQVNRVGTAPTRHTWSLVNPDGLGWHHFDSFPTRLGLGPRMAFFTDSEAERFTRQIRDIGGLPYYYTYDKDQYPEVVQ